MTKHLFAQIFEKETSETCTGLSDIGDTHVHKTLLTRPSTLTQETHICIKPSLLVHYYSVASIRSVPISKATPCVTM